MLDALRDFARTEPVRFRSIVAGIVAVAVGVGLNIDEGTILGVLALLGVTSETSRRKVTPVR
jgi:hypothetical protein